MFHLTRPSFATQELEREFQDYATTKYPNEACAFVIDGKLVPVKNVHEDPQNSFALSTKDNLKFAKAQGFLHSHPDHDEEYSDSDFISMRSANIPFGICRANHDGCERVLWYGDHNLDYPLENRPFISGIFDCYSVVRSIFKQERGIILPDYYREYDWWNNGGNVIEENIINAGFVEIDKRAESKKYDVPVMSFQSNQLISHMAVNMGDGRVLHHFEDQISNYDYLARYGRFIVKVYRYND